jgi:hypothetical protein
MKLKKKHLELTFRSEDIFKVMNLRYKMSWTNKAVLSVFFYSNPLSYLTQSSLLLVIQSHVNSRNLFIAL